MALSGSFSNSVHSGHYGIRVDWSASQSTANNTSTITAKIYFVNDWSINISSRTGNTITINGKEYTFSSLKINSTGSHLLATVVSDPIAHNDDGTKTVNMSVKWYFKATISEDNYYETITASTSATLNTIARASQPSCITYPDHTQNVGYFGDTISIHMNRKSSSFTHKVRYEFGSKSGTCIDADTGQSATAVTNGFKWKIPLDFMNLLPATTTGSGTIYVDTYNGSTLVGTKYCGFTAKIPASVTPSCTFTYEDVSGASAIYGSPVRGISRLKVTVTSTPAYSSPIQTHTVIVNSSRYIGTVITSGVLTTSPSGVIQVGVTDKRRRSYSTAQNVSILNYTAPTINKLSVRRCNSDGTANDRGAYVKVTFSAAVSSMSSKNTAAYVLKYKKSSANSYTSVPLSALANNYAPANYSYVFAADPDSSYDVSVTATDRHFEESRSTKASTAFTLINYNSTGNGITFGGVSEEENTFKNNLEFCQTGNRYAFQPEAFDGAKGYVLLAEITLNTLNVNAPIVFQINRRGALCPMNVYVRFASSSTTTDPPLGSITYDGDNYGAFMVKAATSTWKLYVDNTSGWSNPCLQDWYTTDNQMSRISVDFPNEMIEGTTPNVLGTYYRATPAVMPSIIDCILPVGMIIQLYSHADPNTMYPGTTWVRMANTFLWGCDANGDIGVTGGEKTHTLTVNELPVHSHGSVYSQNASGTKSQAWYTASGDKLAYGVVESGGGAAHNNMPPYTHVSIWRRTA